MQLVQNWREIALKSYSMWAVYLGIVCLLMPELIFAFSGVDTDPRVWWIAGLALLIFGGVGRLFKQKSIDPTRAQSPWIFGLALLALVAVPVASDLRLADPVPADVVAVPGINQEAAFIDAAVPFVARWEGLRTMAYLDLVGVPTVCYGETKGVSLGDRYTVTECDAMLGRELLAYRAGLHRYIAPPVLADLMPVPRDVAFVSLAYNVGVSGAGKSTAVRRLNAGDVAGACDALTWWNKAGGRVVRGLVNRRADEKRLCLQGAA